MRRIDRLSVAAEVLENPFDHRRILDTGDGKSAGRTNDLPTGSRIGAGYGL
jgi:hypothetical protein